ncbi:MAG TPA: hypothetical protein VJQ52_16805 [Steroidobacteraceae bacterium]|nr:hypothetical protein [Steroidobacteraceae bacterium]
MDTIICPSCSKAQSGVVWLHWSEGAVVYACKHCGTFNELSEIRRAHRLRVTRDESPRAPAMPPPQADRFRDRHSLRGS